MVDDFARLVAALAGRYTIERKLGAGGMATVYLAEDAKHHRNVAVKVLRPELAAVVGAGRFLKEIEVTASLQHPNILQLYDSGEADGFLYYVMPYVEGESLRERLARERQLSVEDALEITRSAAAALAYAHERNVIHRDIKPANILMQSGQALVADFGIALAVSEAGGDRLTETGMSMGTPHYMSPEQATGDHPVTARSDVYSLGCVTYEMLAGEPPYVGNSVQGIIAKILTDTPAPIRRTRELVPQNIDAALQKALSKSPADRFTTATSFAEALADPSFTLPTAEFQRVTRSPGAARWRRIATAAMAAAALLATAAVWGWLRPSGETPLSRQRIELWADPPTLFSIGEETAVAPDGSSIAFIDEVEGERRLFLKERHRLDAVALASAVDPHGPFFSPDGEWIGFWMDGRLTKIPTGGGATVTIADSAQRVEPAGAWLDDGSILFARGERVMRVHEDGGPVTVASTDSVPGLWYPFPLPGARGALFSSCSGDCDYVEIRVLDLDSGRIRTLFEGALSAGYVGTGHVVYTRPDGGLYATRFDVGSLEPHGTTVKVLDGVATNGPVTHVSISTGGTLLYMSGPQIGGFGLGEASWVARDGTSTPVDPDWLFLPGQESGLALSPDGSLLAIGISDGPNIDVWIKRLPSGPFFRHTFAESINDRPSWSPDGRSLLFVSRSAQGCELWSRPIDGTGPPEPVLAGHDACLGRWSPDGNWIVYQEGDPRGRSGNLMAIRSSSEAAPIELAATEFHETSPELSPDGRWLAYASDESGRLEVYLRPFPNVRDGKWLVSRQGGAMPLWSRDSDELFFIDGAGRLVAAELDGGSVPTTTNRVLFDMSQQYAGISNDRAGIRLFDVTADGRFLAVRPAGASRMGDPVDVVLVENWSAELTSVR